MVRRKIADRRRAGPGFEQDFLRAAETQILRVWEIFRRNGPLAADEQRLAAILLAHPEWQRHWDGEMPAPAGAIPDPASHPFLHVHLHLLLEQQAAEGRPPEVAQRLDAAGGDRLERAHRLLLVLWACLGPSLREGRAFDTEAYHEKLKGLE